MWRLLAGGKTQAAAAARTDMDEKTARKCRRLQKLPSAAAPGQPLRRGLAGGVSVACRQLGAPGQDDQELQRRHPGRFADGQLWTLQRQVRCGRALHGPAKEVFFAQVHEPGWLAASDFTRMDSLGVRAHGLPLRAELGNGDDRFSESFESLCDG